MCERGVHCFPGCHAFASGTPEQLGYPPPSPRAHRQKGSSDFSMSALSLCLAQAPRSRLGMDLCGLYPAVFKITASLEPESNWLAWLFPVFREIQLLIDSSSKLTEYARRCLNSDSSHQCVK